MRMIPRPAALLTAACLVGLAPLAATAQPTPPDAPRLTVTGDGSATATPDMATISLGITAENPEAGVAMDTASQAAEAILARLDTLGIEPRDRQTSDLSLQPLWAGGYDSAEDRRITGYEARNTLTVRVRDLEKLGDVLQAVLEDGANQLSGLSFGLQNPDPVLEAARRDAVADAMARAQVLAEAAGVSLGRVLSISEGGGGSAPPAPMMEMRAASVPVAAGEAELSSSVTMEFALGE